MTEKEDKQSKRWLGWLIATIVIVVIVILTIILFRGKETYVSDRREPDNTSAIQCSADNLEDAFFNYGSESKITHTVKVTFNDGESNQIHYEYDGLFDSNSIAESADAVLHGQYNKYMGSVGLSPDILNPVFSSSKDTLKISLITNVSSLNSGTLSFFFLNMDDYQRLKSYSPEQLVNIYKDRGFSCTIHN